MIDRIFDWCVWLLLVAGHATGLGYKAINVYVFCVLWPAATLVLLAIVLFQRRKLRRRSSNPRAAP
jgi:hypothetical protein